MSASVAWKRTRLDRVATVNARIGWKALTATEYQSDGYAFLATPNIKPEFIDFANVNYINNFRYQESPELKLRPGDVLLAKDGNTLGIANIVRSLPRPATVNGSIAVLRPFDVEPRFLRYSLMSSSTQSLIEALKGGMGVPHLFQWDIRRLPLYLPNLDEQRRIADFLDAETIRINSLYRLQSRLRSTVLARMAAQTDLRVDELGRSHGTVPFRRMICRIEQGVSPQCDNVAAGPGAWGVLKVSAVKNGAFFDAENKQLPDGVEPVLRYEVKHGDLLITRANTPQLVGAAAVAVDPRKKLMLCDKIFRVTVTPDLSREFLILVSLSTRVRDQCAEASHGASQSMANLKSEEIKSWPIPRAPIAAQRDVVSELNKIRGHTARLVARIDRQLALLAERRQAMITAAVTGQIDVTTARGLSALGGGGG